MKFSLRIALFITMLVGSAHAKAVDSSSFAIFQSGYLSSSPVKIGEANFKKEQYIYNGKQVIYFTVDVKYKNMGVLKREQYESISSADDLSLIYYRFQDFDKKRVTSIKSKDELKTFITYGGRNIESSKRIGAKVFPSTMLYLKLADIIGSKGRQFKYSAIDEEKISQYGNITAGRVIYKGLQKDHNGLSSHIFVNSYGGEKSVIEFDKHKKLKKIQFIKPGTTIEFRKTT